MTLLLLRGVLVFLSINAAAASQCSATQNDVYLLGADIDFAYTADAGACCTACIETSRCAAYSWIPPSDVTLAGGQCHLKNRAGSPTPQTGVVSGQVAGSPPSPCPYFLTPCNVTGTCALFASDCTAAPSTCLPGSVICPGASKCVALGQGFLDCPSLPSFYNTSLSLEERVNAAVSLLSLDQIGPQLTNTGYSGSIYGAPGEPTIGLPPYNWLNEGLHGVARAGFATSMPQVSATRWAARSIAFPSPPCYCRSPLWGAPSTAPCLLA